MHLKKIHKLAQVNYSLQHLSQLTGLSIAPLQPVHIYELIKITKKISNNAQYLPYLHVQKCTHILHDP